MIMIIGDGCGGRCLCGLMVGNVIYLLCFYLFLFDLMMAGGGKGCRPMEPISAMFGLIMNDTSLDDMSLCLRGKQ